MKKCNVCEEEKPESEFHFRNKAKGTLMGQCKACTIKRVTENYHKRGGYEATKKNRMRHGISYQEYVGRCEAIGNKCEICQQEAKLNIDHDHNCCPGPYSCGKCIRGLLCTNCNTALGKLGDSLDRLRSAIKYLGRVD